MWQDVRIRQPWGVTASVKSAPDLARLKLAGNVTEKTPREAFEAGQAGVAGLRRVLRDHGIPDGRVSSSRLKLSSAYQYQDGVHKMVGCTCEAAFTVETGDLDGLQQLLIDVVDAGVNRVEGVEFDVTAKGELRVEARRAAVRAARAKAELYAEAAGVRLGEVVHIEDVNPDDPLPNERYRSHGAVSGHSDEDLAPGQIVVSAAVVLGFSLAGPRT